MAAPCTRVGTDEDRCAGATWESFPQDISGETAVARLFDSSGMPISDEIVLNTFGLMDQEDVEVVADGAGGFVAVWESFDQLGSGEEVFARRFDATGALVGDELQVNTETANDQEEPLAATIPGSGFVVVWESSGGQDGDDYGVYAQRFQIVIFADGFESGDTSAWSSAP